MLVLFELNIIRKILSKIYKFIDIHKSKEPLILC